MTIQYAWTCSCCGKQFNTLPLDWACPAPDYWLSIPEADRARRGVLSFDFCKADEHHFVRGCLEIPIIDEDERFVWGVWVSQSEASFNRAKELFDSDPEPDEPARFGWLNNDLRIYRPSTLHLKVNARFRSGNLRPLIEIQPTDHPLSIEQREGITLARVQEIVEAIMPRH